jgi:uroporphyrin-III C-methyltransferase/precorrin-2 dehydrogenase/sirohydrochlorin ferrochelatase
LPPETTVAVIENASRADRKLLHGTLGPADLQYRDDLDGPVMVIIGDAVAGANFERSEPLVNTGTNSAARAAHKQGSEEYDMTRF